MIYENNIYYICFSTYPCPPDTSLMLLFSPKLGSCRKVSAKRRSLATHTPVPRAVRGPPRPAHLAFASKKGSNRNRCQGSNRIDASAAGHHVRRRARGRRSRPPAGCPERGADPRSSNGCHREWQARRLESLCSCIVAVPLGCAGFEILGRLSSLGLGH